MYGMSTIWVNGSFTALAHARRFIKMSNEEKIFKNSRGWFGLEDSETLLEAKVIKIKVISKWNRSWHFQGGLFKHI